MVDGLILALIASALVVIMLRLNPRIWLQDYPPDIQAQVPPKTQDEKRLSLLLGVPFMIALFCVPLVSTLALKMQHQSEIAFLSLVIHAFGVSFFFNLVDWLLLDWLMFCTITPDFLVIPGTAGAAGYKNYWFHFEGFIKGTGFSVAAGLIMGAIAWFV
jgi:hypothetical protein